MTFAWMRFFAYFIFPLTCAFFYLLGDKSRLARKLEVYFIFLLGIGVAGSGIGNFISHFFLSDLVAQSIGWPAGSPFQKEVAFSNLAIGVLGLIAISKRDGFRLATIIALSIFSFGATIIHIMDMIENHNWAPGNTVQNFLNIGKPVLLIFLYRKLLKEQSDQLSFLEGFVQQNKKTGILIGIVTMIIATALAVSYAVGHEAFIIGASTICSWGLVYFVNRKEIQK